jgi:hypothetical protein
MVWENQDSCQTTLNEAFLSLYHKARSFLGKTWSLVEIGFVKSDEEWVRQWFESHSFEIESYLLIPTPSTYLGTLLLALSSEIGREKGSEEELWRHVKECIPIQNNARRILFPQGQPSSRCKLAMQLAGGLFGMMGMRHFYGYENTQIYFDSVKIQFGFTRRGMKSRLPFWLLNSGVPLAVKALLGESPYENMASQSFQKMWNGLRQYRKDVISKNDIITILHHSSWVKRDWIDEILEQAKARLDLGVEPTRTYESTIEIKKSSNIFDGVRLIWRGGELPRLRLIINEEYIKNRIPEEERNDLVFFIDGKRVTQWNCQEDGNWISSQGIPCEPDSQSNRPNLTPLLLQIRCEEELLLDFDLQEEGILEKDVLLFDGDSGNILPDESLMYSQKQYFFLYDADLTSTHDHNEKLIGNRKFYHLPERWSEDFALKLGDLIYWEPRIENRISPPRPDLVLRTIRNSLCHLGESVPFEIEGIPDDVIKACLYIGEKVYPLIHDRENWRTSQTIPLTASIVLRQKRLRIRLITHTRNFIAVPRLDLNFTGLALMNIQSAGSSVDWIEHSSNSELNKNNPSENFWTFCGIENLSGNLYEGFRPIHEAERKARVSFSELAGWGEKLWVDGDSPTVLAESVSDWGNGKFFIPPPSWKGSYPRLILKYPTEISPDHRYVCIIDKNNIPQTIMFSVGDQADEEGRTYSIPFPRDIIFHDQCLAIAFAYQGARLASHWNTQKINQSLTYCNTQYLINLFAFLRWSKAPVLSPEVFPYFLKAVHRRPLDFIQAWMFKKGLSHELQHALDDQIEPVLRAALWDWIPQTTDIAKKCLNLFSPKSKHAEREALISISHLCPPLVGRIAQRIFIPHQDDTFRIIKKKLFFLDDERINLEQHRLYLNRRIRDRLRISIEDLNRILTVFLRFTFQQDRLSEFDHSLLRRIYEIGEGRIFLSVHLLDALAHQKF